MKCVQDILDWLEQLAPAHLAENWDNVGLLWGSPDILVHRVMTCLTLTQETAAEAIEREAQLILSHHPVLFRPVQKVTSCPLDPNRLLWDLAIHGISVASPHTAFDNCPGGINDLLAHKLGLLQVGPLRPSPTKPQFKIVVFTPEADREKVLQAAFDAGAGRIGAYRECSFGSPGSGTFYGELSSHPASGQAGRRETVPEVRLEIVCTRENLSCAHRAIRQAHSYEEPAIEVYPLHNPSPGPGIGRIGRLPETVPLHALARLAASSLGISHLQYAGNPNMPIQTVAVACGAADDLIPDAIGKADALLVGEARFHRALEAHSSGLALIAAGHYQTERFGADHLSHLIVQAFPEIQCWASCHETDAWRHLAL